MAAHLLGPVFAHAHHPPTRTHTHAIFQQVTVYTGRGQHPNEFGKTAQSRDPAKWAAGSSNAFAMRSHLLHDRSGQLHQDPHRSAGQVHLLRSEWTAVHDVSGGDPFNQDDGGKMFLQFIYLSLNFMLIFAVFIPISLWSLSTW